MKPLFTIHEGEFLVGAYLDSKYRKLCNVWLPSKDTGIDLLVTDKNSKKNVTIQVKSSRDYYATTISKYVKFGYDLRGWYTLKREKIKNSKAKIWVFVVIGLKRNEIAYVVITPKVLLSKLMALHGKINKYQVYITTTSKGRCWLTRGVNRKTEQLISRGDYKNRVRDLTKYLKNWNLIIKNIT